MPDRSPRWIWGARLATALLLCTTLWALWGAAAGPPPSPGIEVPQAGASGEDQEAAESRAAEPLSSTSASLIASLYILILAGFVGFEVIGGVSPLLHTPLMSATNAISAISIVGALVIAGAWHYSDLLSRLLGFAAVVAASINVVGGFMITDRMLRMFKAKEPRP